MYNKYLDTFIEVADTGSFTKASEKFLLSPTAVMKQINMLESELNLQLIVRTHKGVILTESGKEIYEASKKIIDYSNKTLKKIKNKNHTIIIGTSLVCPCKPLIDIWYKISNNHPEYKIKIVPFEEDHTSTLINLKSKTTTFDCIVTPCDSQNWLKDVNFFKLGMTNFCLTVPMNHRLAGKKVIDFSDLDGETIMIPSKGDSETINNLRNKILEKCHNITIKSTPFFYDIDVFNDCAENGYILFSLDFWNNIHPALITIPFEEKFSVTYGVIYRKDADSKLINFIDLIKKAK